MVSIRLSVLPVLFGLVASASAAPLSGPRFTKRAADQATQQANARDAQALNQKFAGLDENSPCNTGDNGCVKGGFAQCVGGKFAVTGCAGGLICAALPLVNSRGTSITCDTQADAIDRIERTGVTGGLTGDGSGGGGGGGSDDSSNGQGAPAPAPAPAAPPANNNGGGGGDDGSSSGAAAPPSSGGGGGGSGACGKKRRRDLFTIRGSTLPKRGAQQDLPALAQSWQDLCLQSGGNINGPDAPCVTLAGVNGISAMLANADPCAQQNNADAMIDFAKSAGVTNKQALIANAIAYRQHPRNSININGDTPSTVFCQQAPKNPELNGVNNAQLPENDPGSFGAPNIPPFPFGQPGSCPFGQTPDVNSCSCN